MKRISKRRIKELGFIPEFRDEFTNGNIIVCYDRKGMDVLVSSPITSSHAYAQKALGVKNETDLRDLCKLINDQTLPECEHDFQPIKGNETFMECTKCHEPYE